MRDIITLQAGGSGHPRPPSDPFPGPAPEPIPPEPAPPAPRSPWVNPSPLDVVVPSSAWRAPEPSDAATEAAAADAEAALDEEHFEPPPVNLPPQVLKRSPGHYENWIRACKGDGETCSPFGIAGPYTEWVLLGAVSWRFPNEELQWDAQNLRFTNNEKANEFIKPKFRKGWNIS